MVYTPQSTNKKRVYIKMTKRFASYLHIHVFQIIKELIQKKKAAATAADLFLTAKL